VEEETALVVFKVGSSAGIRHDEIDATRLLLDPAPTQAVLPLYRAAVRPSAEPQFAHPAELELARVFTFFGIRWAYEPTTFTLPALPDGRPTARFTPDFFLPDHRLYLELTTMRQRLVTRKNSKVRRLTEAYPNVRIKLVYRRDFLRLMTCYRGALSQATERDVIGAFATVDDIEQRMSELADAIGSHIAGRRPAMLVLGAGATHFQRVLVDRLGRIGVPVDVHRIGVTRRVVDEQRVRVRLGRIPAGPELAERDVILVTDVVSSGLTLAHVQRWLQRRGAKRVLTCALLDRPAARLVDTSVALSGFTAPNDVLVGYGLQLRPSLAHLPYIGILRTPAQLDGLFGEHEPKS
jgi:bifunctional protein TilS/HprT